MLQESALEEQSASELQPVVASMFNSCQPDCHSAEPPVTVALSPFMVKVIVSPGEAPSSCVVAVSSPTQVIANSPALSTVVFPHKTESLSYARRDAPAGIGSPLYLELP